jgi:RHS repeat-associated protein
VISGYSPHTGLIEYRQTGPSGGSTLQNLAWEWDGNDNLTQRADLNQTGTCSGSGYSGKLCETFVYDGLNRLDYSQRNGVTNLDLAYDAIGNLTSKTSATETAEHIGTYDYTTAQAGCSYYGHSQRHAVRKAGSTVYCYDANGNVTSRGGNALTWTSYNLPSVINSGSYSSQFWYTPDRRRWKQVSTYPGGTGTETTHYIGGVTEKLKRGSSTQYRSLIQVGSVQIIASRNSGGQTVHYVTTDALGSADRIIDAAGASLANLSFSAFGSRRGSGWTGNPTGSDQTQIRNTTRHGFTWHEHLDNVGLVHMNGRVYDPAIGRFASADPFVQAPYDSQGLNRYSYVGNNPLSFTDPSGFLTAPPNPDNANPDRPPPTWRGDPWNWFRARINWSDVCGDFGFCNKSRPLTAVPTGGPRGDSAEVNAISGPDDRILPSFGRGLLGAYRSVVDGPAPWSEQLGRSTRQTFDDLVTVAGVVLIAIPGGQAGGAALIGSTAARGAANLADDAARVAAGGPPNRIYSARELVRRAAEPGPYHNFPESFNARIFHGNRQVISDNYVLYTQRGSINGVSGTFEIGVRPSPSGRTEVILHRFFRPDGP